MKSSPLPDFRSCFDRLPPNAQKFARKNFVLWKEQPGLKSLVFKRIKPDLWSVRARSGFRALATFDDGRFLWFWIGQKRGQPFRITQSQLREVVMNVGLSAPKIKRCFDDFAAFLPPNV